MQKHLVSMLHESHGKNHIGANHQIHRACHQWHVETPTIQLETSARDADFTNQTWDVQMIYVA